MSLEGTMLNKINRGQLLHDIANVRNLNKSVVEAESRMVVARGWREGETRRYESEGPKCYL